MNKKINIKIYITPHDIDKNTNIIRIHKLLSLLHCQEEFWVNSITVEQNFHMHQKQNECFSSLNMSPFNTMLQNLAQRSGRHFVSYTQPSMCLHSTHPFHMGPYRRIQIIKVWSLPLLLIIILNFILEYV